MSDNGTIDPSPRAGVGSNAPSRRSGGQLGVAVTLVVLAGLAYVVWRQGAALDAMQAGQQTLDAATVSLDTLRQTQQRLDDSQRALDQRLQQLVQDQQQLQASQQLSQGSLQQQVQMAVATVNDQNSQLNQFKEEVGSLRNRVADLGSSAVRAQVVAEAAGLLRLADQRLQVAQDLDSALTLVRNADALLAKLNDAAVATVRSQLANDLVALQAAQQNDAHKVYRQLGEVIGQLGSLHAVSKAAVNDLELKVTSADDSGSSGWFGRLLGFLGRYFVVTNRDAAIMPMLSPDQHWLVHKSVELQLQQARWAALNGDTAVYQAALVEAQAAISGVLQGDDKDALLATLKALESAPLRGNMPSLAASVVAVQQLLPASRAGTTP